MLDESSRRGVARARGGVADGSRAGRLASREGRSPLPGVRICDFASPA